ncbi:MAG: sigma-70 family RNA polymerase sigma factor [Candidatus Stahlbacteria bacterium]|nr:sigma-70 family RNA polymerase sigma factor [Candidatus Stahlbacteria bacterium]
MKIAKLYQSSGVALGDLIDEGNFGLIRAMKTYDLRKGVRLISYASWWIRHYIHRLIYQQMRIVKIPVQRVADRRMIRKMEDVLIQKLGRLPHTEEIAKALDITSHEVNRAMEAMQNDLSLDIKIDEDETVSLLDFLRANPEELEDSVVRGLLAGELEEKMINLSETEKLILRLRFGLAGELCHKLREIGELLNLSRERVRQIEQKALEKLRRKTE